MREGLAKTPVRAAKALLDITAGYKSNPLDIARQAIFNHCGSKMVIVRDIEFYSTCEHHILPFFGKMSIGYLPKGRILGLSKLARVVDGYARRLQVQERLRHQVSRQAPRVVRGSAPLHEGAWRGKTGIRHHHPRILRTI